MMFTRKSQNEVQEGKDERKPSKNPMVEGIAKKAAAATLILGMALGTSACTMSLEDRFDTGDRDAIVDANDGDVDVDGDVDQDAGVDAGPDEDLDAGIDAGPDEDLDGGVDAGPDEDLDAGIDAGPDEEPACPGVHEDQTEPGATFPKGEDVSVGGYLIRYVSAAGPSSVYIDVRCEANGADVAINQQATIGAVTDIDVPDDGMRIRIAVHSQNVSRILCTVVVEPL